MDGHIAGIQHASYSRGVGGGTAWWYLSGPCIREGRKESQITSSEDKVAGLKNVEGLLHRVPWGHQINQGEGEMVGRWYKFADKVLGRVPGPSIDHGLPHDGGYGVSKSDCAIKPWRNHCSYIGHVIRTNNIQVPEPKFDHIVEVGDVLNFGDHCFLDLDGPGSIELRVHVDSKVERGSFRTVPRIHQKVDGLRVFGYYLR